MSGVHKFSKVEKPLQIPGTRKVTSSKFYTDDPQILGATVQNLVVTATWRQGFLYPTTTDCHRFANHWVRNSVLFPVCCSNQESLRYSSGLCNVKPVCDVLQVRTCSYLGLAAIPWNRHIWRACPDGIILKLFVFNTHVNTGKLPWEKPRQPPTELMSTPHTWLYPHLIRRCITPAFETLTQELKKKYVNAIPACL